MCRPRRTHDSLRLGGSLKPRPAGRPAAPVSPPESNPAAASQQPPPQQQSAGAAQQPQQQPAAAAPPTNGAAAGAPRVGTITLNYYTGWHDAFIHYDADKKGGRRAALCV